MIQGSWKTSLGGMGALLGGLALLCKALGAEHSDPQQLLEAFALVSAGFTGIFARDNNKSSEDVGAKKPTGGVGVGVALSLVLGLLLLPSMTGCADLAPNGAYHGDKALYAADRAIVGADDTIHEFVKWELSNREALAGTPEIRKAADELRKNARVWIGSAEALRDAYEANPTPENKVNLDQAMAVLDAALLEATKYMVKK